MNQSWRLAGGTSFTFICAAPAEALAQATQLANGKDVRMGGGPTISRAYFKAGVVDHLYVAITPILLGSGISLWDDLRGWEPGYAVRSETA